MNDDVKSAMLKRLGTEFPSPEIRFHQLDLPPLATDILRGVRNIAIYMEGNDVQATVRRYYNVIENSNTIPTFPIGSMRGARKSTIRAKFWSHEKRAFADQMQEDLVRLHILLTGILHLAAVRRDGGHVADPTQAWHLLAEAAETIQRVIQVDAH